MLLSSKIDRFDGREKPTEVSLRAWTRGILDEMEPAEEVFFMFSDIDVVRNYVSSFSSSKNIRFLTRKDKMGIYVRRAAS